MSKWYNELINKILNEEGDIMVDIVERNEVVQFKDGDFVLDVNVSPQEETVWLSANQMAKLFDKDEKTIRKHINNIVTIVIGIIRFSFKPSNKQVWLPNITAMAAIVAGKNNTDCIQPVNIPNFLP